MRRGKERGNAAPLTITPETAHPWAGTAAGRQAGPGVGGQKGFIWLPTSFLIGGNGRGVVRAIGTQEWASVGGRALIESLLLMEQTGRVESRHPTAQARRAGIFDPSGSVS